MGCILCALTPILNAAALARRLLTAVEWAETKTHCVGNRKAYGKAMRNQSLYMFGDTTLFVPVPASLTITPVTCGFVWLPVMS